MKIEDKLDFIQNRYFTLLISEEITIHKIQLIQLFLINYIEYMYFYD